MSVTTELVEAKRNLTAKKGNLSSPLELCARRDARWGPVAFCLRFVAGRLTHAVVPCLTLSLTARPCGREQRPPNIHTELAVAAWRWKT